MNEKNKKINDWIKDNYDIFKMKMPKGEKEKLKALATEKGYKSISEYIRSLYKEEIDKNTPPRSI